MARRRLPGRHPLGAAGQDDDGATFIISQTPPSWIDGQVTASAEVIPRDIGPSTHPTVDDLTPIEDNRSDIDQMTHIDSEPAY